MPEYIAIDDVIIPEDRQRREFDDAHISELAESLANVGYIHPVALRNNSNELVAGETRIRAHRLLLSSDRNPRDCPVGMLPITRVSDLDAVALLEAELDENLKRRDLTWQEETIAIAKLHELRSTQHKDWTFADTANELHEEGDAQGSQRKKISDAVVLAKHMDDPLVAHAKNKKDAIKAVKTKHKHAARAQAVEDFDDFLSETSDGYAEIPHTLIHGDYFDKVASLPTGHFDIVLTDPPYGIDIHRKGTFDLDTHEYDDSKETFDLIIGSLATETMRITKDEAHLYLFCDVRRWQDIDHAFFAVGWDCWPRPLIWHKGNIGSFANVDIGPRSTYECIFYAVKGHRPVQHNDMDVILVNQSTHADHPANKPVGLYSNLLARSAFPGDKVVDLFCGSGPIFPSATEHNCIATGIEVNDKYYAMAFERLKQCRKK